MNKQELIDKLKRHLTVMSEIKGSEYDKGYNWATKQHLVMIAGLDEPEKPVVPQYVADFYESIKDDFEDGVYELCIQLYNCDLDGRIKFWFDCDDNKPIETLVKMKLYGYEVEKEKLYTVEIPNPNNIGAERTVLMKNGFKQIVMLRVYDDNWRTVKSYQLTESEIKKDFDWAWQFAKVVKE